MCSTMMSSRVLLLLQLLLLTSLVSASHHWGGAMNFAYKGRNPDGTYKLSLRIRSTYDACYYYHYWYCYEGNCGYTNTTTTNQIDTSTNAPMYESQWCETETIETWNLPTDKPLKLRSASCCWISTRNSVFNWNFDSLVDFGARSDTRQPNKSPQTAIVPFLRVPQNCPRTYKLAAFDPDGDRVRCRYGNLQGYECDNCHLPSGFQLDQDSCTLHYQQTNYDYSVFGFEMVVEDYPRTTIDLFYSDGSSARNIQDIIFSGPSNVTKHRDINNDFVIRWTPVDDDLGDQYPICFAVESVSGSSYFQSEMRCVLVEIRKKQ
ncbi:hypothetical protein XENOCAPTIV_016680, partial [Xenoophorus captivus]